MARMGQPQWSNVLKSFGRDTQAPPLVSVAPSPCSTFVLCVSCPADPHWKRIRKKSKLSAVMGAEPVTIARTLSRPTARRMGLNTNASQKGQ